MDQILITPEAKPKQRHTLSYLGLAGGVVSAMVMLQPVKDFFYTREEGRSVEHRMAKVEDAVKDLGKELGDSQQRNSDKLMTALGEQDRKMDARFTSLENSINRNIELLLRREALGNNQQNNKRGN